MFKKNVELCCEKLGNNVVIFDPMSDEFYEFEGIGSSVWDNLEGKTEEMIIAEVCEEYNCNIAIVSKDIHDFLGELLEKRLIFDE